MPSWLARLQGKAGCFRIVRWVYIDVYWQAYNYNYNYNSGCLLAGL